jgi:Ca-activated chloride channel family protein
MDKRKQKVLVLGTVLVLVGMGFAAVPVTTVADNGIQPPTVTKTVSHEDIYFGTGVKETQVTIEVTGAGGTSSTITPMDVVFAIDSSGSMGWNDPAGLRKTAAKSFVDSMDDTRDQGAVVSWDHAIDFTKWLTSDLYGPLGVKHWIDQVNSVGGTNLNVGLGKAIDVLDANTRVDPSAEVIIFLTDGQGVYTYSGNPGAPADIAAGKGYTIYSIGLGPASAAPLEDMADATGGDYYSAATPENLQTVYDTIYEEIVTSTIPHFVDVIEVTESYIIGHNTFNIAPDSITNNLDGTTTLIWENVGMYADGDPDLSADETVTLSFYVRSAIYGMNLNVEVYGDAKVDYYDKDENYIGNVPIPQATINVHPLVKDLIAGGGNPKSAIDVGEVVIWNDLDYLYVKYVTTDGWYMTETHLHVADSLSGIPQTKTFNPIPGQFAYPMVHNPAVQEYMYSIPWTWNPGTTLYIATHAVVQKQIGIDVYGDPVFQEETAWGDCVDFLGKNWASYIIYEDP